MNFLATFLSSVFAGLFSFLVNYFSKKIAIGAAVAATLLGVTAAFYTAVKLLVAGLFMSITNQWLLMGFYAVWPSNAETCITAIFSAEVAAFLYRHQLMTIKTLSSAT